MDPLAISIAMSLAIYQTESPTYVFECGYYIDDILIHEATPMYGGTWWGCATYNKIIIKKGLSPEERMMVFAHERFHYERIRAGLFNKWDLREEERLAYIYGWNESNWDPRILRFRCIED